MTEFLGLWMFPALIVLIAAGIPIAFSMLIVAFGFGLVRFGDAVIALFVTKSIDVASNYVLGAVPLFIFMGAILQGSGVAEKLFDAIYMWTRRLPGSLALAALLMCTVFGAVTGVAGAVETLVGLLALPPMMKHGYHKGLISGTICAGGSLGTAIPPSITVIVLAPIADVSVGDLFAGIMLPGLVMSGLFILYILIIAWIRPDLAPATPPEGPEPTFLEKLGITFVALVPTVALIAVVLGTILAGAATPTEAAACGAFGALVLSAINRRLKLRVVVTALYQTLSITAMILFIVMAGSIFSAVFYATGGMTGVTGLLDYYGFTDWQAIAFIMGLAFLGGFLLDLISIVLILIPIAMPIVTGYGVNDIWFCVLFLIILQTSYLSPPMAPSIFYLRAIAPVELKLSDMYRGVTPFIGLQVLTFLLVLAFPGPGDVAAQGVLRKLMSASDLHPALVAHLEASAGAPPLHTVSVETARAGLLARFGSLQGEAVASVEDWIIAGRRGDIRIRIYRNDPEAKRPILVYFHGGGFVVGNLDTHDASCRYLCAGANVTVVSVDYALAPENKYPAGLHDCIDATRWVAENATSIGGDPARIALGGDSAGASLAAVVALHLVSAGDQQLSGLLLAYPVADAPDLRRDSYRERGDGFGLTAEGMKWFFEHYLERPEQARDPSVAPLRWKDTAGLPPTWLLTAEYDPLRDEGIEFARKLEASGVDVVHVHQDDGNHGFMNWAGTNEPSKQALDAACKWLSLRLA